MIYAYIRISTDKQFIINQKEEILNFVDIKGLTIDKWVTETISGKVAKESRKLGKLLKKNEKRRHHHRHGNLQTEQDIGRNHGNNGALPEIRRETLLHKRRLLFRRFH